LCPPFASLPPPIPAPLRTPPTEPQTRPRCCCIQQGQWQLICQQQCLSGLTAVTDVYRGELKISLDVVCLPSVSGTQMRSTHLVQPWSHAMHTAVWHLAKYAWQGLLGCTDVVTPITQQPHRMSYGLRLLMAALSYSIPSAGMGACMRKDSTTCGYLQVH